MTTKTPKKPLASTPTGYPNGYHPDSLTNLAKGRAKLAEMRKNGEITNPEGYSLTAELKHALNKQKRLELVNSTIEGAIAREVTPFNTVWDRTEGKVPEPSKPLPEGYQDNRVLNIIVLNVETKDLIGKLAGWTQKPQVGQEQVKE